ncbi:SHOCT domain-containing protein [Sulfobacillus sp. hq2]|uniref:SHOCT domain-containing protein n=1 Tax=Sulfobacillus thermotolerans TaxID=338644 RepID=A0ABM6RPQ5_9FIRM|nr:SHOCT domain-containing protein [Sulfobacillus sp. hq2]AUW93400.1 hypothetical protein BXT84_05055 [Sulfobacillus thermotolerans]MCY0906966.1 SHOCT domain-containing protein [Sulfobacillus thermotolerans]POB10631.1 hypothetical protein CO251_07295 [Sulfobacillus sp. hq2]
MMLPQSSTEIPTAIFNFFMLLLLWRFSLRLLRRPRNRRRWLVDPTVAHRLPEPKPTPLEIAQDRYARGELTDKEFEQVVERLLKSRSPSQDW